MNDDQLLRYSRHILLPQIDYVGQQTLLGAHVLLIGLGGLGSPIAMYLAAAGIGQMSLIDPDRVSLSNLQRQIIHRSADIERLKVESARDCIKAINPDCVVNIHAESYSGHSFQSEISQADVIIDASDNFTTRFAVNMACVRAKKPLVSGAAIRFEGQISVFDMRSDNSPCYACLYNEAADSAETCSQTGVLAPLLGVIGSLQAIEAIKLIIGSGTYLVGKLLLFDALNMEWRTLRIQRDPHCSVCGQHQQVTEDTIT